MKTLILVPELNRLHGIVLHFLGLEPYWNHETLLFQIPKHTGRFRLLYIALNSLKFMLFIKKHKPGVVMFNTSLKRGFYNQFLHFLGAKFFSTRSILFIHGWDLNSERILSSRFCRWFIGSSDAVIVLSHYFKSRLLEHGIKTPIYLSSTKVEDAMLHGFSISNCSQYRNKYRMLFVSRVEHDKGILFSLAIFSKLREKIPSLTFHIVGDGAALDEIKDYASYSNSGVVVKGRLSGEELVKEYREATYFFLQSKSEGMPAALLESLAFGLVPIVSPVGAVPDFFVDGEMGIMSDSQDVDYYVNRLIPFLVDESTVDSISYNNHLFACHHFLASKVVSNLEAIIKNII